MAMIWRLPICLINQYEAEKATVCDRHQTRKRKIKSKRIKNVRGMPGIMQVRRIPRLWPGPGLGLKLWSLGLGLSAGPGPWARAWAQAAARCAPGQRRPGPRRGPKAQDPPKGQAQAPKLEPKARPGPKPGNTPDLHDSRITSGIHNLFAFDFPFPGLMSVAYRCLF